MPGEQGQQRRVIARRHRGDQRIVVHCFSMASRSQPVHPTDEILSPPRIQA
jgi:hypothetical protein